MFSLGISTADAIDCTNIVGYDMTSQPTSLDRSDPPIGGSAAMSASNGSQYIYTDFINSTISSQCLSGSTDTTYSSNYDTSSFGECTVQNDGCSEGVRLQTCYYYHFGNTRSGDTSCDVGTTLISSLPPPQPIEFSNGVQDPNEEGIDCGGANPALCVETCVSGILVDGLCLSTTSTNSDNTCPTFAGYYLDSNGDCTQTSNPVLMADTVSAEDYPEPDVIVADPSISSSTTVNSESSSTTADGVISVSSSSTTTATNSDGSEAVSVITETTETAPDGSSTVTTVTNSSGENLDSEGSVVSVYGSSTTSTETFDADGNSEGVEVSSSVYESEEDAGSVASDIAVAEIVDIDFQPILDLKDNLAGRFPISLVGTVSDIVSGFSAPPAAPSWTIDFPNPWGSSISFDIDLAPMQYIATIIRNLLALFVLLCGFFLLYKRWT